MRADWPELPGYELTELLGTGGMASVYLANQLALGRKVAIKVMSQQRQLSPQELARFEREARLLASLEHPHIVSVFEVGRTADGRLFYVMPHMPGGDLSEAGITGNEIAIAEVLDKILSALEYAHARGVIHRDLKPGNILFDALGQPRLADFGVARPSDSKATRLTSEGMVVGSASYMAPEQARGEAVDGRADLYSLGVTAFELLTGRLPYRGPDAVSVLAQHISAPIPILPRRFRHWQPFLQKALAKDPRHRFASATEMRRALRALRTARRGRRAAVVRIAVWSLVAVLVALTVAVLEGLRRSDSPDLVGEWLQPSPSPGEEPHAASEDGEPSLPVEVPKNEELRDPRLALLARARGHLNAGALSRPPGDNATALALEVLRYWPEDADAPLMLAEIVDTLVRRAERALAEGDRDALRDALEEASLYAALRGEEGQRFLADLAGRLRAQGSGRVRRADLAALLREYGLAAGPSPKIASPPQAERDASTAAAIPAARVPPPPLAGAEPPPPPPPPDPFVVVPLRLSFEHASSLAPRHIAALPRPVTSEEYAAFIAATGRGAPTCPDASPALGPSDPAVCVSVADAEAYASWIGERLSRRARLPTADELQHVALHQVSGLDRPLVVREWTLDCAAPPEGCAQRLVLVPAADPLYWPLRLQGRDPGRGHRDVGFRLVLE